MSWDDDSLFDDVADVLDPLHIDDFIYGNDDGHTSFDEMILADTLRQQEEDSEREIQEYWLQNEEISDNLDDEDDGSDCDEYDADDSYSACVIKTEGNGCSNAISSCSVPINEVKTSPVVSKIESDYEKRLRLAKERYRKKLPLRIALLILFFCMTFGFAMVSSYTDFILLGIIGGLVSFVATGIEIAVLAVLHDDPLLLD